MRMKKEDKNKIYQLLELIYPDKSKELLDVADTLPYNIDGLIYIPIDSFYPVKTKRAKWM